MRFRDGLGNAIGVDEVVTECAGKVGLVGLLDGNQAVLNCAAGDTFHHTDLGLHVVSGPDPENNGETQRVFFPWTSVISLRTLKGVRYYIGIEGDRKRTWVYPIREEKETTIAPQLIV